MSAVDCKVVDCVKPSRRRGWCFMHYYRWLRNGDPLNPGSRIVHDGGEVDRFWAKVVKSGPVPECRPDLGQCWLWTASAADGDYGKFWWKGTLRSAHCIAYEEVVGPIPAGLVLDHLCRNHRCVNPEHLEPVTSGENVLRGTGFSATNAAKTHCPANHPYDDENTYVTRAGRRHCKTCHRERQQRKAAAS